MIAGVSLARSAVTMIRGLAVALVLLAPTMYGCSLPVGSDSVTGPTRLDLAVPPQSLALDNGLAIDDVPDPGNDCALVAEPAPPVWRPLRVRDDWQDCVRVPVTLP